MAVQITIIGTGQIGASVGLALAPHTNQLLRVGHDKEYSIAQKAKSMGAFDQININLPASVEKADIVFLALPIHEIYETVRIIIPDLKEDCVIIDTSPVKKAVAAWMKELLPAGRHYVGLTPVINPAYLNVPDVSVDSAKADLFKDGAMAVCAPAGTAGDAIKLASDLACLMGSTPFFADLDEVDGIMASAHILPQLIASALTASVIDQPGWREARKVAGRAFAQVTSGIIVQDPPQTIAEESLLGRENVIRGIDRAIASLQHLRALIADDQRDTLKKLLNDQTDSRLRWEADRKKGDWTREDFSKVEAPRLGDILGRFVGWKRKDKDKEK
jgi:prephenate dehydrogenase